MSSGRRCLLLVLLVPLFLAGCGGGGGSDAASPTPNQTSIDSDNAPPSAPGALTVVAVGSAGADLSWAAASDNIGVTGYRVRRNGVQIGTSISTSYSDGGLLAATTYRYTVEAVDAAGNTSPDSIQVDITTGSASDTSPPTQPDNLAAIAINGTTINLGWNPSSDNVGVIGYIVRRDGAQVAVTGNAFYTDSGLVSAKAYSFTVAALDAAGNVSPNSTSASATTPDTVAPSAPGGLTATAMGGSAVGVAWTASTDNVAVTGYVVKRNGVQVATISALTYNDSGLTSATTYQYAVAARDAAGNISTDSAIASASTADTTAPSIPTGLRGTAVGASQINLSWNASTDDVGVVGYVLKRNGTQIATPAALAYADTNLAGARTYVYTVAARDLAGNTSADSPIANATTADGTTPSIPTGVVAIAAGPSTINLTWTASTDNVAVTGYIVKREGVQVGTSTSTSYADSSGIVAGLTYSYTVASRDAAGNISADSAAANATTADTTAPTIPGGLIATATSGTAISLSWTAATDNVGVTGYVVRRNSTQVGTSVAPNYIDSGLTSATSYSYTVSARDAAGNFSPQSSIASATTVDTVAPSRPSGLSATPSGANSINLTWTASTDNVGVVDYVVKRANTQIGTTAGTGFSDMGLSPGITYTYSVAARDAAGNTSTDSIAASAVPVDNVAPTTPGGLAAIPVGASMVNLTWSAATDNVGVTGYIVRRNGAQISTPTTTAYSDSGLSGTTTYSYTVAARDAANNISPNSAVVNVTTGDGTPPTIPTGLVATAAASSATINLSWTPSTDNVGVTAYLIKRNGSQVGTSTTTSYSDSGLVAGTTYSYTVAARDALSNISLDSTAASATTAGSMFPLHTEAGKHYLVDASGKPFLLQGDAGWSLVSSLSREDAERYLEDRRLRGFNTVIVNILDDKAAPANFYGALPFTGTLSSGLVDYDTPNPAYFSHVDWVVQKAADKGILILLVPSYLGFGGGSEGWYVEMVANDTPKMYRYGRYLGQRYASYKNIVWVMGGDFSPPTVGRPLVTEIARGIRDFDTRIETAHCSPENSALDVWSGQSWLQLNSLYTYIDVPSKAAIEYNRSTTMPFFLVESQYENELQTGSNGNAQRVRVQAYQALLSGATGQIFGNNPMWHFDKVGQTAPPAPASPDWRLNLASPGAQSMTHLHNLFAPRAWSSLVPDATHALLTAGYADADPFNVGVAAKATDTTFAIVYLPTSRSITVNLAQLAGPRITARWYDPASGVFTDAGSPFTRTSVVLTPPGTNSSGFSDWVLLIESMP